MAELITLTAISIGTASSVLFSFLSFLRSVLRSSSISLFGLTGGFDIRLSENLGMVMLSDKFGV